MEQTLSSGRGLPGREWYRHMLYAPGRYTGYAAKTLPAIREAIELHQWLVAEDYIPVVAGALNAAAAASTRPRPADAQARSGAGKGRAVGPAAPGQLTRWYMRHAGSFVPPLLLLGRPARRGTDPRQGGGGRHLRGGRGQG